MNILLAGFSYPYAAASIRISTNNKLVRGVVRNYNIDKHGICVEDLPFIDSPEICEKLFMYRYPNAYRRVVEDVIPQEEVSSLTALYVLKELLESSEIYNALVDVQTQDELYVGLHPNHIDVITLGGSQKILLGGNIDEIVLPDELVDIRTNIDYFIKTRNDIIELLLNRPKPTKEDLNSASSKLGISKKNIEQLKEALKVTSKPRRLRRPKRKRLNEIQAEPQEEPDLIGEEPMKYYTYDPFKATTNTTTTYYTISTNTYTSPFKITED